MAQQQRSKSSLPQSTSPGALEGIRVIDLTSVVMGPYATQILGDMGADVIKVESPEGDVMRHARPARNPGMGAVYLNSNRNKRSVVLNLKEPADKTALQKMIAQADVFIHSMRPKAIAKLGFDYDSVRALKADIIYASTWGFKADGPYGDNPAYDDIIQAASGLAGLPLRISKDRAPEFAPSILADKVTGLTAAYAVAIALFHKARTGEGQNVEVPMLESITAFNLVEHLTGAVFRPQKSTMGYDRMLAPHRRPHPTLDGHVAVLPYTTRHWQKFFGLANKPEMQDDLRVTDPGLRSDHIGELYAMIGEALATGTTEEWLAKLKEADIPCTKVNSLEDLLVDPHLKETGFFVDYEHPSEGALTTTAPPTGFSATPANPLRRLPPRLGEHTDEVLAELGIKRG